MQGYGSELAFLVRCPQYMRSEFTRQGASDGASYRCDRTWETRADPTPQPPGNRQLTNPDDAGERGDTAQATLRGTLILGI